MIISYFISDVIHPLFMSGSGPVVDRGLPGKGKVREPWADSSPLRLCYNGRPATVRLAHPL
jgi:hypothetical protein